jgi:hypothetical protein
MSRMAIRWLLSKSRLRPCSMRFVSSPYYNRLPDAMLGLMKQKDPEEAAK